MEGIRMKTKTLVAMTMMLLFAVSCTDSNGDNGVATPKDKGEPLWTIHANLEGVSSTMDGDFRLAFIWRSPVRPQVAEDIAVSSESPLTVDLNIYELPDESILVSSDETVPQQLFTWEYSRMVDESFEPITHPTVLWSQADLVMYEDVNGNGALDLLSQEDAEGIDRIVGGAFAYDFYYIESDEAHPFPDVPEVTSGLNMVSLKADRYDRIPISLENNIAISLDDSRDAQRYMCPNLIEKMWEDGRHTDNKSCDVVSPSELLSYFPAGIVENADGHCADQGFLFEWFDTSLDDGPLCSSSYLHGDYKMSRLPDDAGVPEYWPCDASRDADTNADPYFVTELGTGNEVCSSRTSSSGWAKRMLSCKCSSRVR